MEAKQFDRHDHDAFAGAEGWPDGAAPLIAHSAFADGTAFVLVLDKTGGCLVVDGDEQNQYGGYVLALPFPTQAAARVFAAGLGEPRSRDDFLTVGFQAI